MRDPDELEGHAQLCSSPTWQVEFYEFIKIKPVYLSWGEVNSWAFGHCHLNPCIFMSNHLFVSSCPIGLTVQLPLPLLGFNQIIPQKGLFRGFGVH